MGEEELNLEDILSQDELDTLMTDYEETQDTPPDNGEDNKKDDQTTEVDVSKLFSDEPESVGSEDNDNKGKKDTTSNEDGSSPKNIYSSIANALLEDGIFTDLDEKVEVNSAEDFAEYVEKQVLARLEDKQKRIDEALKANVEPSVVKQFENTLNYLDNIDDGALSEESDKGETLRKQLIYQDLINRGFSQEKAQRELKKSLDAGTDIEDAKDALKGNKEFFGKKYLNIIDELKLELEEELLRRKESAEKLKKSIIEDKEVFGDLEVDKNTRLKIYDNISKPIYKDPDTGELLTAIQKYQRENNLDFLKNLSAAYTLTNGFKDLGKLLLGKVNKEKRKALNELERTINHTRRSSDGSLQYVSSSDDNSYIGKGFRLDV